MANTVIVEDFGKTKDGKIAKLFTLKNNNGICVKLTNYGATAVSMLVPDSSGSLQDIILGFDDVSGYENTTLYLGATIGRYAGQINDGSFTLGNETYTLFINDHNNTLHGGEIGFNKRLFSSNVLDSGNSVEFRYLSPDGEEGFPGNLNVCVTYTLTSDDELVIKHTAVSDKDTVLNMTNHSYFNLDGHASTSVLDHYLRIRSNQFTEVANDCSPNGIFLPVDETPMDFRVYHKVGERIDYDFEQLKLCGGYDHNWVIDGWDNTLRPICDLKSEKSGISLEVFSDLPGLQVYSGNYLNGSEAGKSGIRYDHRSALCLEPQYYPNSLNHSNFPSPILYKGEVYNHTIVYQPFSSIGDK